MARVGAQAFRSARRPLVRYRRRRHAGRRAGARGGRRVSSPPDQAARDRIAGDLDATLFVEAGAGAGKTTSLISRIQSLIEQGVAITSVAAITFTEKAAAELRVKLRRQLVAKLHDPATAEHHGAYRAALDDLDHAPIGTLHAFAR